MRKLSHHKHRIHRHIATRSVSILTGSLIITITALLASSTVWYFARYDWYGLSGLSPDEVANTLVAYEESQGKTPRLKMGKYQGTANVKKHFTKYDDILREVAKENNLDCTLLKAQMLAESRGNASASSNRGALGLMQLMPRTARAMGVTGNLYNPRVSLQAGAKYIRHLMLTACYEKPRNSVCDVNRDYKYIFAAYNGGPKANDNGLGRCASMAAWECTDYDGYYETRIYVGRVKANYDLVMDNDWGC